MNEDQRANFSRELLMSAAVLAKADGQVKVAELARQTARDLSSESCIRLYEILRPT